MCFGDFKEYQDTKKRLKLAIMRTDTPLAVCIGSGDLGYLRFLLQQLNQDRN